MANRLATNRQLWRLNEAGWLELRQEPGTPLTTEDGVEAVRVVMEGVHGAHDPLNLEQERVSEDGADDECGL